MAGLVCVRCQRLLQTTGSALLRATAPGVFHGHGWGVPQATRSMAGHRAVPSRGYVKFLPDSISAITEKRREFSEERILGYTPEDVYAVIANLNDYKHFLPWCKDSVYLREGQTRSIGHLVVGFPPLLESYTALVLHDRPRFMRTIATDGRLFSHLENIWLMRGGPDTDTGPTCIISFWVHFEFRSLVYAQLGGLVFDEIARTMAKAFEARCVELYGPNHLRTCPDSWEQLQTRLRALPTMDTTNHRPGKDPYGSP